MKKTHFEEKTTNDEIYNELIKWLENTRISGCTTDWNDYKKYIESNKKYSLIIQLKILE